jgi:peroxiredoxin Q/BCP
VRVISIASLSNYFPGVVKSTLLVCLLATAPLGYAAVDLNVGDTAPKFEAAADTGTTWKSEEHAGKKIVVLYFYPASFTGGCTAQARAFRDDMKTFADQDVEIVGMSGDTVRAQEAFKKLNALNFTLLSDENGAVAGMFGVPTKPGGTVKQKIGGQIEEFTRGVTIERWTFVIDKSGKIAYKNTKVNPSRDSKAVLDLLKTLK